MKKQAGYFGPLGGCALALVTLGSAASVHADAYDAALTRAIAAKERSIDVNEPARWEETLRLLQEADAVRSTRECKYEMGFAAERLKRADLAVEAYEAALHLGLVGAPRAKAEAFVGEHASAMARLSVRGPAGLRLRIGGVERGHLPLARPLVVFAGETRIEGIAGDQHTIRTVSLASGQLEVIDLAVPSSTRTEAPPPPPRATVVREPFLPTSIAPPTPMAPVVVASSRGTTLGWALAGTGVGLGAFAAVLAGVAAQQASQARSDLTGPCAVIVDDTCPTPRRGGTTAAQSLVNDIATWKAVSVGAWIGVGAGILAAGSGTALLWRGGSTSMPSSGPGVARWLPQMAVERTGASLVWAGGF